MQTSTHGPTGKTRFPHQHRPEWEPAPWGTQSLKCICLRAAGHFSSWTNSHSNYILNAQSLQRDAKNVPPRKCSEFSKCAFLKHTFVF